MKNKNKKLNEPLKLMRWAIDRFPPIDLNENYMHVVELTKEIKRLRHELKQATNLPNQQGSIMDITSAMRNDVWSKEDVTDYANSTGNIYPIANENVYNAENYLK